MRIDIDNKFLSPLIPGESVSHVTRYEILGGKLRDFATILDRLKRSEYDLSEPVEFFGVLNVLTSELLSLRVTFPKGVIPKPHDGQWHFVLYGFTKTHNKIEEEASRPLVKAAGEVDGTFSIQAIIPRPLIGHRYLLVWSTKDL